VVFLHGIAQSRAAFRPVLTGPLADDLHLVAVDLRGHGSSDKPVGDNRYAEGNRLGDDLHELLTHLGLVRPIVVAWSYGGVVVGEYLRLHGGDALGGVLLVAASVVMGRPARALFGPTMLDHGRALMSEDTAVYEAGARAFVEGSVASAAAARHATPSEAFVADMLLVPPHVRRAYLARSEDFSAELARCSAPLATLHGAEDTVVLPAMSEHVARTVPASTHTLLPGVGHMPFLEAPEAFIAAVRGLVAAAR
jgi:pimeloyl-ACP methyl ester carboxylesterase